MPRNMSFALTTEQFKARTKTVTRRFGWWCLKPVDILMGVEMALGLKRGEKVRRLGLIRVVSVRGESLDAITLEDCALEGFPDSSPQEFVRMIYEHYGCNETDRVNRIEFEHIQEGENEDSRTIG